MGDHKADRRRFLTGAAGLAGLTVLGVVPGCAPTTAPTAAPPTVAAPTAAPAAAAAAPTAAPTATTAGAAAAAPAATATTAPASAPAAGAIKYANKAATFRYMTGGYTQAGPDDPLVKQYQEDALRKEYGLNVDVQFESASWADIDQLMDVRLQTQATDGVQRYDTRVLNWIATPGLIRDIDAEVKQYGQTLLKEIPKAAWEFFMRPDGKYIAIPFLRSTPADIEYIHIRRDWLDKVNREIPTTVEELEEALRLFKDKKLGGAVTIPFANENPLWMLSACLIGPWVPNPEEQIKLREQGTGQLYLNASFNEDRLTMLQRWFKDGLLNPEWTTWKYDQVYEACSKGMVGCLSAGHWTLNSTIQDTVLKADPSQDWVQIFPPVGRKGIAGSSRILSAPPMERGLVVTTWAQAPEAIVALADWDIKSFDNWMTSRNGIKDKHWKVDANGKFVNLKSAGTKREYSGIRGVEWIAKWQVQSALMPAATPPIDPNVNPRIFANRFTLRKEANVAVPGEYPSIGLIDHWLPYLLTKTVKSSGDLDTVQSEYFTKIVNGEKTVADGVKEFWTKWRAAGGDARGQEMAEQWATWIKAHPEWKDPKASLNPEMWNTKAQYPDRPKKP